MNSEETNAMTPAKPAREPFDFARWWDRVGILMVLVALVLLDHAVQVADRLAAALDGLHEDAATIDQHARDALLGVVLARAGADGFDGGRRGVDGAAGVKQTDEHA